MTEVCREYSEALFALASESGRLDEYANEISIIKKLLRENHGFVELLASPAISADERRAAVTAAFFGGEITENLASFICLVSERGHAAELCDMFDGFEAIYRAASGVSTAYVKTAVELSESERDALTKRLENKLGHRVELSCEVDTSLIGGVVVSVDGFIMDGSIKGRLKSLGEMISR